MGSNEVDPEAELEASAGLVFFTGPLEGVELSKASLCFGAVCTELPAASDISSPPCSLEIQRHWIPTISAIHPQSSANPLEVGSFQF